MKDGKNTYLNPIYRTGIVGQVVILANVSFGEKPDLEKYPLAAYQQPHAFTIVKVVEGAFDGYYIIEDENGKRFKITDPYRGHSSNYLYDANQYLAWQKYHQEQKLEKNEKEKQRLQIQLDLLTKILIAQGVKVVSEETAKQLGL